MQLAADDAPDLWGVGPVAGIVRAVPAGMRQYVAVERMRQPAARRRQLLRPPIPPTRPAEITPPRVIHQPACLSPEYANTAPLHPRCRVSVAARTGRESRLHSGSRFHGGVTVAAAAGPRVALPFAMSGVGLSRRTL